jgi:Coatomer epsilon subunit
MSSAEPDELYTLRAQYWLGHYTLALNEIKSLGRRPGMNPLLKIERDEIMIRCYIALQQYSNIPTSNYESSSKLLFYIFLIYCFESNLFFLIVFCWLLLLLLSVFLFLLLLWP